MASLPFPHRGLYGHRLAADEVFHGHSTDLELTLPIPCTGVRSRLADRIVRHG